MRRLSLVLVMFLALAACSSGSGSSGSSGESGSEEASSEETPPTTEVADDPCVNALEIVNGAAETSATVADGEFETVTMWADKAPHPDNTVDYDSQVELAFFSYPYAPDEQFGYSIPIDPETPDGQHFLTLSMVNPDEPVAAGQRYVDSLDFPDDPDADGEINFTFWEQGSARLLPGDIEVTITEVTDDVVCGEISTVTGTDLQQFVGIQGTFATGRAQALDAAAEAAAEGE